MKMVKLNCMVCQKEYEGPEPEMCCSGRDCGCMGMPIDPVVCCDFHMSLINHDASIQREIRKATREQNPFWWGCVVGISYGKIIEIIRVSENSEATAKDFLPIVRIKYGSPYKGQEPTGRIISWYEHRQID